MKNNIAIPNELDLNENIIKAISALPAILDVDDVARFLRISSNTVRKEIAKKRLPAYMAGSEWAINRYDFFWYVNNFSNLNHDA